MSISDLPPWARFAIVHKVRWVNSGPETTSPTAVIVEDGGAPVALVLIYGGEDPLFRAIRCLSHGFQPDAIVCYNDTWYAARDPERGEELAEAMRNGLRLEDMAREGGLERGTVTQAMFACRRESGGLPEGAMLPYRHDEAGIEFDDDGAIMMGVTSGRYPDLIQAAMDVKMDEGVEEEMECLGARMGIAPHRVRVLRARAALNALRDRGCTVIPIASWVGSTEEFRPPDDDDERRKRRPDPQKGRKKR